MNANASEATIVITFDSQALVIQVHNYFTKCTVRLYDSLCQSGIYLPWKMKVERDPGLVRDKFSVRYEC